MRSTKVFLVLFVLVFACVAVNAQQTTTVGETKAERPNPLLTANTIFVRSKTAYFKSAALEQALLERDEFQNWGFAISREEADAELIIEVDRKLFSNRFIYSVIDPETNRVLLGGNIGSLGGTVESQIANGFVQRLKRTRPLTPSGQSK